MRHKITSLLMALLLVLAPLSVYAEERTESPKTISLDIKGMDIIDALKLLSKQANLNIVAGKNVRGKVTLFLKDVDPWYAFEIILAANNLAFEEKNGIITVMAERDYELMYGEKFNDRLDIKTARLRYATAAEASKALNQIKTKVGTVIVDEASNSIIIKDTPLAIQRMMNALEELDVETETMVYTLNYAVAEKVKEKVTSSMSKIGTIEIDERTNKMIITDVPRRIDEIELIIDELDEMTKQVLIDAKIIQIDLTDEYKLGVNWDAFFNGLENIKLGSSFQAISSAISPTTTSGVTGGVFRIGELNDDSYQTTVRALETLGRTRILSSPRILTVNNEEAKVLVGTNQPYATSTTSQSGDSQVTSYQITYLDLGVKLYVTPTINMDKYITMKLKPEISSQGTPYEYGQYDDKVPVVTTSMAETTVMVRDGTTLVIAGLMQSRDQEEFNKVPILGDIPIIGNVFRSKVKGSTGTTNEPEKKELVIFITPRIVSGDVDAVDDVDKFSNFVNDMETWEQDNEFFKQKKKHSLNEGEKRQVERLIDDRLQYEEIVYYEEDRQFDLQDEVIQEEIYEIVEEVTEEVEAITPIKPIGYEDRNYKEYVRGIVHKYVNKRLGPRLKGEVFVKFSVLEDGYLKEEPLILKSSNDELRDTVIEGIENSSPFPPFPTGSVDEEKTFKILISY